MKVKWLGHASFLITSVSGLKVIIDPYTQTNAIAYGPINESADVVLVTHEHFDHNNVGAVQGKPEVIKGPGSRTVKGVEFRGIAAFHDEQKGAQRGAVTLFCFSIDGLKLCHLGDLGHEPDKEQLKQIGPVDILMMPVGGFFTIDAAAATRVSQSLNPKVVLPMHYKTPKCNLPIAAVDEFLKGKTAIKRLDASEAEFKAGQLPASTEIVVLKHAL
ncbi:MAG: MBL fold metallo-hydrolase [Chloroflexi bacterium]|nr:MBL fold metallo-hydrolase [Chloroflexota bacterium]